MISGGAALVTGGARRIGRALVLALAGRGHDVAVHFNGSADAARHTVDEARAAGVNGVSLAADFEDEDAVHSLVERASQSLGKPVSILVNNAAVFEYDRIETATTEDWHRHLRSNLQAPFFLTQTFARQAPGATTDESGELVAGAVIINMVDNRVLRPTSEFATYSISKAGLWALTQSAAVELAPSIRVNAIGPGPTLRGERQSEEHFRAQRQGAILGRGGDLSDLVAALGCILDSDSMTGQILCLDGGQFMQWNYRPVRSGNPGDDGS